MSKQCDDSNDNQDDDPDYDRANAPVQSLLFLSIQSVVHAGVLAGSHSQIASSHSDLRSVRRVAEPLSAPLTDHITCLEASGDVAGVWTFLEVDD